jgi:hypothetical protein
MRQDVQEWAVIIAQRARELFQTWSGRNSRRDTPDETLTEEMDMNTVPEEHFDDDGHEAYDRDMDRRLTRLEMFVEEARRRFDAIDARLDRLERRLEDTAQQLRAEMQQLRSDIQQMRSEIGSATRWIIGTMIAIAVAAVTAMTFVLNNATPARAAPPPRIAASPADGSQAASQPVLVVVEVSGR